MADELPFPDWNQPARKGDLVRSLAYLSTAINALGGATIALQRGDKDKALDLLQTYLVEVGDVAKLIDELGGRRHGD